MTTRQAAVGVIQSARRSLADCHAAVLYFFVALFAVSLLTAQPALAQNQGLPAARLTSIFPAGAKQGATVDCTITGVDLDAANKLYFSDPGITAVPKMGEPGIGQTGPQHLPGQFTITVKPEVKPGLYDVRAIGKYGISSPRAFIVGSQPEINETEPNDTLKQAGEVPLGTVVNGRSDRGTDQDYFKFTAKAGQRILIDCWAYRIDSRMDATLVLYNAAGGEIARNRDTNRRDALIDFTAPADGEYTVEIHDFLYGGGPDYFYRLTIGAGPYIDFIFPPAGTPGATGQFTLYGRNLPGGQPAKNVSVDGRPLEMLAVQIPLPGDKAAQELSFGSIVEPAESAVDAMEYRLSTPQGISNPVLIGFAEAPIVAEQEPNNEPSKAQLVKLPCEYVGQFAPRGDQDWLSFEAKKGETISIEVFSQRLGLPTDPYLLVQHITKDDKGVEKATDLQTTDDLPGNPGGVNFDVTTDDPSYRFTAPADGLYRVMVRDLYSSSRGDPRYVYRLVIRQAVPDFRLVAVPRFTPNNGDVNQVQPTVWTPLLRKGGSEMIDVTVFRRDGFDGEITVAAEGLPAGVTSSPITIGPNSSHGSLVLSAAESAAEGLAFAQIVGKAKLGAADVARTARNATMIWGGQQNQVAARSRLARNLAIAITGSETAPCTIDAGQNVVLEMSRAGSVKVPLKVTRRGDFKGNLAMIAMGLPQNVQPKNMSIDAAKADGEFEITLPNNAPLGTYSFVLLGTTQVNYARNPEAAKEATDRKAAVDKLVIEMQTAAKAAADAKTAADKLAADTTAAAQKATEGQKAADKAVTDSQAAAAEATKKSAEATTAADKDANNQALVQAKAAALKVLEDANAKVKAATDAKAVADKALADAQAAAKTAADAKAAAEKTAQMADAKAKELVAFQQTFNQQVNDLTNKAKPQAVNVGFPSTTVTLKITAAPITATATAPASAVKQGTKVDVPVTIARLYNYADAVQLKITPPQGVNGISAAAAMVPAGQTAGTLSIDVSKDATPGTHKIVVSAVAKFGGQDLPATQEINLTVEKVEPAK